MLRKVLLAAGLIIIAAIATGAWMWRPIPATHPALAAAEMPPIIPLREFYANTDARWRYRLSPDGKHLSWLESKWFRPALWVRPLDGDETSVFHTTDTVRWYTWAADSKHIVYQADRDGWENDVIVSIDTSKPGSQPRTYDFGRDVKAGIYHVPKRDTSEILISHNGLDRSRFDIYRLDLESGKTEPLELIVDQQVSYAIDLDGNVYARRRFLDGADWVYEIREESGEWRKLNSGNFEDVFWTFGSVDPDGQVFARSNLNRDKTALVKVDLATAQETVIAEDASVDIDWSMLDPVSGELLVTFAAPGFQKRIVHDPRIEADFASLNLPQNAAVHVITNTRDNSKLLVTVEEAEAGFETRLIDRLASSTSIISTPEIAKYRDRLPPVEPVFIPARDGVTIPAFLSRPKGVADAVPMVIIIHGGPVARSYWGHNEFRAMLNNRGYAVLDVNYRGSWGYGRRFREAAIGEVSRKMHYDIVDARAWAVEGGIADPASVAVFGGSFGGLKVLTALTQDPELFAAGIDINGVSDLATMIDEVPVYWRGWPDWARKYMGDPSTPEGLRELRERSPLTHASNMTKPLLIVQGANDVRVIRDQSDRMVAELEKHDAPFEYELVDGAGHQLRNWSWQKRLLLMRRVERFLAEHLGGRADGFDYTIPGAYIIPE